MTRAERNNNPLNIRRSKSKWLGAKQEVHDKEFCEFTNLSWGFRAAFKLLETYVRKHKCLNLIQVINRWAPPSENNTGGYIAFVSKAAEVRTDELLPPPSKAKETWCLIVRAMARMESGKWFPIQVVRAGWELAQQS